MLCGLMEDTKVPRVQWTRRRTTAKGKSILAWFAASESLVKLDEPGKQAPDADADGAGRTSPSDG